jgi:ribosome-binding protein aMBF1 (putative translation factor)
MGGGRREHHGWLHIRAKRAGRCDLCGRTFKRGAPIRYERSTYRVRCPDECLTVAPRPPATVPKPAVPKRLPAKAKWQGEYVYLFDRDDYWFRRCVVCGRSFEGAAGRVAQAKKSGVCPACEENTSVERATQLREAGLAEDRTRYLKGQQPVWGRRRLLRRAEWWRSVASALAAPTAQHHRHGQEDQQPFVPSRHDQTAWWQSASCRAVPAGRRGCPFARRYPT